MAEVLVIEDEPILAKNICKALEAAGHAVVTVGSGEDGLGVAEKAHLDLILLDYRLPGKNGLEILRELRRKGTTASVVMMTAHGNIDTAVEAMKAGAGDFLSKPLDLKELQLVVERALQHQKISADLEYFRDRERAQSAGDQVIGESKSIQTVKAFIERIGGSPALSAENPPSLLITGETGTGKDLVARAIHYCGPRRAAQFVHVNCTALPDHLVESELFGHVKGAFTDAKSSKRGLFEIAEGGTVFLDEIGHMDPALQAKLLSVLEQRKIRPLGATRERKTNVHVIAATNRDLAEAIRVKEFREDLFHRLRTLSIHLSPLRERKDDICLLSEHFREMHASKFGLTVESFSDEARDILNAYDWPGNVRELSHVIEHAVLMTEDQVIRPEHFNLQQPPQSDQNASAPSDGAERIELDFAAGCPTLDEIEIRIIKAAMAHTQNNISRAARILGISRDAVRYRLEKHGKRGESADA